jgi:hypothetical protein
MAVSSMIRAISRTGEHFLQYAQNMRAVTGKMQADPAPIMGRIYAGFRAIGGCLRRNSCKKVDHRR